MKQLKKNVTKRTLREELEFFLDMSVDQLKDLMYQIECKKDLLPDLNKKELECVSSSLVADEAQAEAGKYFTQCLSAILYCEDLRKENKTKKRKSK